MDYNLRDNPRLGVSNAKLSLKGTLFLIITLFFFFSFSIVAASSRKQRTHLQQIEQIQQSVQAIDARIAREVTSSFYLESGSPYCSEEGLYKIKTTNSLIISLEDPNQIELYYQHSEWTSRLDCFWNYVDTESKEVIAKDIFIWGRGKAPELFSRAFYSESGLIAQDWFGLEGDHCFKRREYLNRQGQIIAWECFSEAGVPTSSQGLTNSLKSPIPPMLYWFFYRG